MTNILHGETWPWSTTPLATFYYHHLAKCWIGNYIMIMLFPGWRAHRWCSMLFMLLFCHFFSTVHFFSPFQHPFHRFCRYHCLSVCQLNLVYVCDSVWSWFISGLFIRNLFFVKTVQSARNHSAERRRTTKEKYKGCRPSSVSFAKSNLVNAETFNNGHVTQFLFCGTAHVLYSWIL